jgi:signal peptidase I
MGKFRSLLWFTAILLLAIYIVFGYKYKVIYNTGESMEPHHSHREWIILERAPSGKNWVPDRYDVVVFHNGGEKLTKRVIGLPGDTVEIKNGYIFLNGKKLEEPYGKGNITYYIEDEETRTGKSQNEWLFLNEYKSIQKVPEGHFWAIGDNRPYSWFGVGKISDIIGVSLL